ncbi:MAG: glycosyltransferase [Bacteroidota bacterium]|nr:glycosyltransferase [Bacteroidota bacterium]
MLKRDEITPHEDFSVLMSTYYKEKELYLRQSFDSLFSQTLIPTEIVLVEDGPLPNSLENTVKEYAAKYSQIKIIRLEQNRGLGYALNIGLQHCTNDIVVRMDSDDICYPNRFLEQITYLVQHPDVDVVSAWIDEFVNDISNVLSTRKIPETDLEIRKFAKRRNPINHPVAVFRKNAVEEVGGYEPFFLFEDYFLWVKLLSRGAQFYNIQKSLLYFRQSEEMYNRRGGWDYVKSEVKFQWRLYQIKFLHLNEAILNILVRTSIRLIPNKMRRCIYQKFLR